MRALCSNILSKHETTNIINNHLAIKNRCNIMVKPKSLRKHQKPRRPKLCETESKQTLVWSSERVRERESNEEQWFGMHMQKSGTMRFAHYLNDSRICGSLLFLSRSCLCVCVFLRFLCNANQFQCASTRNPILFKPQRRTIDTAQSRFTMNLKQIHRSYRKFQ